MELAAKLADEAFPASSQISGGEKAAFLRTIAAEIEVIADQLVARAHQETALPEPRLQGELARTCGQLRLFASIVEEGSWTTPRIDRADPQRKPIAKPDLRFKLVPLGPAVVFGASNFPLAFFRGWRRHRLRTRRRKSCDRQSPSGTSWRERTCRPCDSHQRPKTLSAGGPVFPALRFRNFPGWPAYAASLGESRSLHRLAGAGRAPFDLAVSRPDPIPFYGEMASSNPRFLLPGAVATRREKLALDLYGSFTLGAGQFCTKPGLVFVRESQELQNFLTVLRKKVSSSSSFILLTRGIAPAYERVAATACRRRT